MTPTAALDSLGVLNGWTVAAHGVWLDDADMEILKARDTGLAHNPSSNMKLASGVAPVVKILSLGIPMGLGTDGVAGSNNDHDMMEEMDLAAKLQKVTTGDPRALPAEAGLRHGDHHRRARAAPGQDDRVDRERQARRHDRDPPRRAARRAACTTCTRSWCTR